MADQKGGRAMSREALERIYCLKSRVPAYQAALEDCRRVADSGVSVMILGESGTGKDIAAQYIHACSGRAEQPFVAVNCSAYPETLLESELFGYEQGAFTGAVRARAGRFEQAEGGTLFVDEIGDISLTTQVKLLRAIETRQIERVGANWGRRVDFRLISATNKDPAEEVSRGRLREDFLYRVSTVVIRLPALRERRTDLEDLISYFMEQAQREHHRSIRRVEPEVQAFLLSYQYPGNLRELKNIIERMVVLSEDGVITPRGMPVLYGVGRAQRERSRAIVPWRQFKAESEAEYLSWVLEQTGHNVTEAARLLGLSARQLFNKISAYGLR